MDGDPALDVTLSDGRQVATFQIAAVGAAGEWWTVVEPWAPHRVVLGSAAALEARRRLDRRIAARLRAGWVPVDAGPALPLSSDLALQIGSLLEALDRARGALRAADPSGRLGPPAPCSGARRSDSGSARPMPVSGARSGNAASASWPSRPATSEPRSSTIARRWRRTRGSASRAA